MITIPTTTIHNTISVVAEAFGEQAESLEALVEICKLLGVESGSHSMLALGDYIKERVEALDEEGEELDDDGIFEAFLDGGGDEEDFVDMTTTTTTTVEITILDDDDDAYYDHEMHEDSDGTFVTTKSLTCRTKIEEIDVLSKKNKIKTRHIIVDADDDEVLCDNDGKGYKTRAKAENALWSAWIGGE